MKFYYIPVKNIDVAEELISLWFIIPISRAQFTTTYLSHASEHYAFIARVLHLMIAT